MKYLSRLTLDTRRENARDLLCNFRKNRYSEHQQIWSLFDPDPNGGRDFLYRRENGGLHHRYLVLSERQPRRDSKLWQVESREYSPRLSEELLLRFLVRVTAFEP